MYEKSQGRLAKADVLTLEWQQRLCFSPFLFKKNVPSPEISGNNLLTRLELNDRC